MKVPANVWGNLRATYSSSYEQYHIMMIQVSVFGYQSEIIVYLTDAQMERRQELDLLTLGRQDSYEAIRFLSCKKTFFAKFKHWTTFNTIECKVFAEVFPSNYFGFFIQLANQRAIDRADDT